MEFLDSLKDDHRLILSGVANLESLMAQMDHSRAMEEDLPAAGEAQTLLHWLQPLLGRHQDIENHFLFPELLNWDPEYQPVVTRLTNEYAEIAKSAGRLEQKLSAYRQFCALLGASVRYRNDERHIDEADADSFPASDAPPWTLGQSRTVPPGARGARKPLSSLRKQFELFSTLLKRHLRTETADVYPEAERAIPPERLEILEERSEAEEFPEYIDTGAGD